jgi:light-regulated signal transduction histidine kinase (bacteriophytochrome)
MSVVTDSSAPLAVAGAKVDLNNCDREPIHLLGGIQSFAYLLALTSDWMVARVSANIAALLGRTPAELLGKPVHEVLGEHALHQIRNRLMRLSGTDAVERMIAVPLLGETAALFDLALHYANGCLIIEAEAAQPDRSDPAASIRSAMTRLEATRNEAELFREGVRQVRAITGFDRVMLYRFDAEGAGEVVAEAARSGIGSFLGLHYPASDIPAQARQLYVRNLFRVIADINAETVPILPPVDVHGAPLDLSLAVSRAVSTIHIEYLRNMGVAASLSVSIIVDGKLWGLFACHHYSPRLPSLERRGLAELFGQMFAMKLEARLRQAASHYLLRGRQVTESLLGMLVDNASMLEDPGWLGDMLNRVVTADGVGVVINGRMALSGLTPDEGEFKRLLLALNGQATGRVFVTDRLASLVPDIATPPELAAGMLAMPISRTPRDYVVLFRQEIVRTVRWAGDPHKPVEYGPNGPRLTPRKSFESWAQLVKGRSKPFSADEVQVADMLRATLIEVVLRVSEAAHVERRQAAERQEVLIAELNHRVRNVLNLIRSLVRQTIAGSTSIEAFSTELDGRIDALARAHNQITSDGWGPASLRLLIQTEADAYLAGRADRVRSVGPELLLTPVAFSTMALVLHELMTNSAKYGALSDSGQVQIDWTRDSEGSLRLHWTERRGPVVKAPIREGFGSVIIKRSVPYELGGSAEVQFAVDGFAAHFTIPARHVSELPRLETAPSTERVEDPVQETAIAETGFSLGGASVLLVEDSLIIALYTEDLLGRIGAGKITVAATVQQGLDRLRDGLPDYAVLDVNLGDQTSIPLAKRLQALGVPFLFASGYGERPAGDEAFADVPVVQKPYTLEAIARGLATLQRP